MYHPLAVGAAVLAAPAGGVPWATVPFPATPKVALTTSDMALALRKDIDPGGVIPFFLTAGLQQVFDVMYSTLAIAGLDMLVATPAFAGVPGNWLNVFSQMVAAATSLAVAEKVEGYPFCLSMQFCKVDAAAPGVGPAPAAWPLAYRLAIPQTWRVMPRGAGLMPDYVIAKQNGAGVFEFSALEAKGRDVPVDQNAYPGFATMKAQSQNAVIVVNPNLGAAAAAAAGPPPVLTRRILSLVAIRPKTVGPETRALRCRWTNHRNPGADGTVSDADGLRFVVASYAVMLHNIGFARLAEGIATFFDLEHEGNAAPGDAAAWDPKDFGLVNRGFDLYALHQGELSVGDCLLPRRVFRLTGLICDSLVRETGQRTRQRRVAIALWRHRIDQGGQPGGNPTARRRRQPGCACPVCERHLHGRSQSMMRPSMVRRRGGRRGTPGSWDSHEARQQQPWA